MKAGKYLLFLTFVGFAIAMPKMSFSQALSVTGTYQGYNDEGKFVIVDANKKEHLFDELGEDVAIDLYDEKYVGKKFKLTYAEEEYEAYDDDGEFRGNYITYRTILTLDLFK